jgi:lipid-binding SYLF domain-containing protein
MRASLAQLSTGFIQPFSGRDGQAVLAAKGRNSSRASHPHARTLPNGSRGRKVGPPWRVTS